MSLVQTQQPVVDQRTTVATPEITIYSHSPLFYWWPVWTIGYLLAAITYMQGHYFVFDDGRMRMEVLIHPSKNLGVLFMVVVVLVLIMTNVSVRGLASFAVIVSVLAITLFFAYMGWWDEIFRAIDLLALFMNLGFYIFFSTAVFIIWFVSFFIFDRMTYWRFRPGQMIYHRVFGGGEQTYDTRGMSVNKLRDDLFRHWILGLGSGDMHIRATGAVSGDFIVHNVLFIGRRLNELQQLVATKPDETPDNVVMGKPE